VNKKKGKLVKLVKFAEPELPEVADDADPGKVAEVKAKQAKTKKGKYGSVKVKPAANQKSKAASKSSAAEKEKEPTSFVGVKVVDEDGIPVSGESVEMKLPDGSIVSKSTDADGVAKFDEIPPGQCEPSFVGLDNSVVKAQ
jgi:hypothetical protein